MLPQGLFSVAVATVLFPTLSRMAARRDADAHAQRRWASGMRQINLLLIPAAAFMIVLPTPIVRLLFERGAVQRAIAPTWSRSRCSGSPSACPFGGLNLLLTRTFFAVQRPWIPTRLAAMNIIVDIIVSVGLYKPLGIAGLIIGTVAANAVMTALQLHRLRIGFNGRLEGAQTTMITARILLASALLAGVSWAVWRLLDDAARRVAAGADRQRRRRRRWRACWSTRARCSRCASPRPTRSAADPRAPRPG